MALTAAESLERLRALQRDLLSLSETTIPNVDSLCAELEANLEAFRTFVRKPARNDTSRSSVQSGLCRCMKRMRISVTDTLLSRQYQGP